MNTRKFKVVDPHGINSRSYAKIVGEANKLKSQLTLKFDGEEADLKSIMNVMALLIRHDDHFEIVADGVDEDEALDQLETVLRQINII